eukprot:TRINITY_DN37941_c0_g1_i1.p1 TRINITY_DN37941_c0_g1~~TRINITY_DN37941_c0_g1_i1.p1  ORF type:complete len:723 (+),score=184.45 TRINITY_DN37941_c0_g1_i1:84-2171(+)
MADGPGRAQQLCDEGYAAAVRGDHSAGEAAYRAAAAILPDCSMIRVSWAEELSAVGDGAGAVRELWAAARLGEFADPGAVESEPAFAPMLAQQGPRWEALKRERALAEAARSGLTAGAAAGLLGDALQLGPAGEVHLARPCTQGAALLHSEPLLFALRWALRGTHCAACAAPPPSVPYPARLYRPDLPQELGWLVCRSCRLHRLCPGCVQRPRRHRPGGAECRVLRELAAAGAGGSDTQRTLASLAGLYAAALDGAAPDALPRRQLWELLRRAQRAGADLGPEEREGRAEGAAAEAARAAAVRAGVGVPPAGELGLVLAAQREAPHSGGDGGISLPGAAALVPCGAAAASCAAACSSAGAVRLRALRGLAGGEALRVAGVAGCDCGACCRRSALRGGRLFLRPPLPGCPAGTPVPWEVTAEGAATPRRAAAAARSIRTNGFAVLRPAPGGDGPVPRAAAARCGAAGVAAVERMLGDFAAATGSDPLRCQLRFNELCDRSPLRFDALIAAAGAPGDWEAVRAAKSQWVSAVLRAGAAADPAAAGGAFLELASGCVVSYPGCPAQAWHHDGKPPRTDAYLNAFVALCDTTAELGPTEMAPWPRVWCAACEAPHPSDPAAALPAVVAPELPAGAIVFTSYRCYHRGGANRSDRRRPLAYYAHAPPGGRGVRGSGTFPIDRPLAEAARLGPHLPFPGAA